MQKKTANRPKKRTFLIDLVDEVDYKDTAVGTRGMKWDDHQEERVPSQCFEAASFIRSIARAV